MSLGVGQGNIDRAFDDPVGRALGGQGMKTQRLFLTQIASPWAQRPTDNLTIKTSWSGLGPIFIFYNQTKPNSKYNSTLFTSSFEVKEAGTILINE